MSDTEIKNLKTQLVKLKAEGIMDLDDAYPDVGMGKFWTVAVDEALVALKLTTGDVDMSALAKDTRERWR